MKDCKVENLIYYSELTSDPNHILKNSKKDIQEILNKYAENGYSLVSTHSTKFDRTIYIYLFFEKDI